MQKTKEANSRPIVSVIVPIYNTEKYLNRCIESILEQNNVDIELILVNDGSTDRSGDICNAVAEQDRRVKVIRQTNQGVSAARNAGLEKATGKYISFVDSDDTLPENALEQLINATKSNEVGLVIGDCDIEGDKSKYSYLNAPNNEYSKIDLCIEMVIDKNVGWLMSAVWAKLFSSTIIKKNKLTFDNRLVNGEDGMFIINYLSFVEKIANVKKPVYTIYRYDETERVSATSAFYYDFFEFYLMYMQKLWNIVRKNITGDIQVQIYTKFIDQLIIYLVHAAAYEKHLGRSNLKKELKDIVQNELVRTSLKFYRRTNPLYSRLVPFFMRTRCSFILYYALKYRVKKYWQTHTVANLIKSIYQKNNGEL